jgi:hypothetical protein
VLVVVLSVFAFVRLVVLCVLFDVHVATLRVLSLHFVFDGLFNGLVVVVGLGLLVLLLR